MPGSTPAALLRRALPLHHLGHFLGSPGGRTFLWLWLGQLVSTFGTHLSAFALGLTLFQRTGEATPLALSVLCSYVPATLLGPFAGVLADRADRRWLMLLSDGAQALTTLALLLVMSAETLPLPLVYALLALGSAASTAQAPAATATVSQLVPAEHLGRAHGLMALGEGIGGLAAPVLASVLLVVAGLRGVLLTDLATFLFSAGVLAALRLPRTPRGADRAHPPLSLASELRTGWRYITARRGLLGLLLIGSALNLIGIFVTARLHVPLVLARTGEDTAVLALVSSAFGLGLLLGGAGMATWGGPHPRIYGTLGGIAALGVGYQLLFGLGYSALVWAGASFLGGLLIPVQSGSANALWQARVPPALQGRVFAVRRTVGQVLTPVGLVLVGPLADQVAAPFLASPVGQRLLPALSQAPGGQFALVLCAFGLLSTLLAVAALGVPWVRSVEQEVPEVVGTSEA